MEKKNNNYFGAYVFFVLKKIIMLAMKPGISKYKQRLIVVGFKKWPRKQNVKG